MHAVKCQSGTVRCSNSYQSIRELELCDESADCSDGSDEIGCRKPPITLGQRKGSYLNTGWDCLTGLIDWSQDFLKHG